MTRRRRRRRWFARVTSGALAALAAMVGYVWAEDVGHARGFMDGLHAERRASR